MKITRNIYNQLVSGISDTPVVMLIGPRQSGKSTLTQMIQPTDTPIHYSTMDDPINLAAAKADPLAFIKGLGEHSIIDEIQRAPELLLPIKMLIDQERTPGRFILTGSANVLNLPKVADSLAGRMEIHTLWPLSQGEIAGHQEQFIDTLFNEKPLPPISYNNRDDLMLKLITGGFPEVVLRKNYSRQQQWFKSYLNALIQRDIRDLANLEGLSNFPTLLNMLATRVGSLCNAADISRMSGISATTMKRYLALLENIFLVIRLPAWSLNADKRVSKTPKLYFNDSGLLCNLLKIDRQTLTNERHIAGPIFENFVFMEILKQTSWSQCMPDIYHFRNHSGHEVDIVLEAGPQKIVGIEIKLATQVKSDDFKGLRKLQDIAGNRFLRGVVLYTGDRAVTFSDRLTALPINALWEYGASA